MPQFAKQKSKLHLQLTNSDYESRASLRIGGVSLLYKRFDIYLSHSTFKRLVMGIGKLKWIVLLVYLASMLGANAAIVQYVNEAPGVGNVGLLYTNSTPLYTFQVSAGLMNLVVNNVPTQGFCIDIAKLSSTSALTYSEVPLSSAPHPWPGPMNATGADLVQQLWGNYFAGINSALDPNLEAASMQLAIWRAVATGNGANYTVSVDNTSVNARATQMLEQLDASKTTSLIALINDTAQDYVISVVPEASTMIAGALALLPLGLSAVRAIRRNHNKSAAA
jgi:hypothetical protein